MAWRMAGPRKLERVKLCCSRMFETVAPEVFRPRARRAAYESLPVSVGIHIAAIAAALIVPHWNAVFPDQPPRLVRSYSIAEAPEPPPPPPAPPSVARSATAEPASTTAVAVAPPPADLDVAPTVIPDEIPIVPMRTAALSLTAFVPVAAPAAAPGEGVAGASGATGGAGKSDALLGGVMVGDRVQFARNSNLPLFVVHKRYPQYPDDERMLHREDDVTLRYVIGKDGAVKEVIVLEHPRWPNFEKAAVSAIRTWKFRPFRVGDEIHEVVHELVVSFRLE